MRPLVSNSTTLHRKKSKHFTKAIKRAIILVSFGVNKTTLTPLSDLFALNDSFAFICLIPERLLCCSILTHSIRLFFKAKCCGFLSGSVDAGFQQSWNPLHKLKSLLFCIVRIMLACWNNNNLSAVGIGWPWGAGGIPDMPRDSLGITERCVCKSTGGRHCSCCEHFLNSLHKPLRDYGPVVLNWKAVWVSSADPFPKSSTPFMPQGGAWVFGQTNFHCRSYLRASVTSDPALDQGAELVKDYKNMKLTNFHPFSNPSWLTMGDHRLSARKEVVARVWGRTEESFHTSLIILLNHILSLSISK